MTNHSDREEIFWKLNLVENIGGQKINDFIPLVNYVFLCSGISVFGIAANVINLAIFYTQGLDTTINISFFSLAISDLCSLVMQQCYNVFVNPWFEKLGVPGVTTGIQFIVAGVPRELFARTTCLVTVYITAERCFCIVFPLHVKQLVTPRRTSIVMLAIFGLTILSFVPLYCITYIDMKFNLEKNVTLPALVFRSNSQIIEGVVMFMHAISGTTSFLAVVLFTMILIKKLTQKNTWRMSANADSKQGESMTNRDRKTISMVALIATILILSYTPSIILYVATFVEPEFSIGGKYAHLYTAGWSFACVFECINSSINIFLYYRMSTKYRETFHELFYKS